MNSELLPKNDCKGLPLCHFCRQAIQDAFYLKVEQHCWHEDCLRCDCCEAKLAELEKTCFAKAELLLCRKDYLRWPNLHLIAHRGIYQTTDCLGSLARVAPAQPAYRPMSTSWRLTHWSSILSVSLVTHAKCGKSFAFQLEMPPFFISFCVGDRYFLQGKKIFCETDFEFRQMKRSQTWAKSNRFEWIAHSLDRIVLSISEIWWLSIQPSKYVCFCENNNLHSLLDFYFVRKLL